MTRFALFSTTLLLTGGLLSSLAWATELPEGNRTLVLLDTEGQEVEIGTVLFTPTATPGERHYQLLWNPQRFTDHFLSMKEMKCIEGKELWCRIPYPYSNPQTVTPDNLLWLEHDLLFMFKRPAEYGANFWNGIYYQLRLGDEGIRGEARAVDLNLLASPPDDETVPPIGAFDSDPIEPAQRWLPHLLIR